MKTSDLAISKIQEFEGCRLSAYQDSVGVWTIGYGHTKNVKPGDVCTPEQAKEYLIQDISLCEAGISRLIHFSVTQGQFDALVSFTFNLGLHTLATSSLLSYMIHGCNTKASEEFEKWCHAGKEILPGLLKRRQWEKGRFLGIL